MPEFPELRLRRVRPQNPVKPPVCGPSAWAVFLKVKKPITAAISNTTGCALELEVVPGLSAWV